VFIVVEGKEKIGVVSKENVRYKIEIGKKF
jgi:hypothetical protein